MDLNYKQFIKLAEAALSSMKEDLEWQKGATTRIREFREKEVICERVRALFKDLLADETAVLTIPQGSSSRLLTSSGLQFESGPYTFGIVIEGPVIQVGTFISFTTPNRQLITGAVGLDYGDGSWTFVSRS